MFKFKLVCFAILMSTFSYAEVSFEEKINRLKYLKELTSDIPIVNLQLYERELEYEKKRIPIERRAQIEANLLAESIRLQVQKAYESSLEINGEMEALKEIRSGIERDLGLIAEEFREELGHISLTALDSVRSGGVNDNSVFNLTNLEGLMLKRSKERSSFFNSENEEDDSLKFSQPSTGPGIKSFENSNYVSKSDIISSLVSDYESSPWVSSSSLNFRSDSISKIDTKINFQLKVDFLGATIEAGPSIAFKREYKTSALIMAEDLYPVLLPDGRFDNVRKDKQGKILLENGKPKKRYVSFSCDASLGFETEYVGSGGFLVAGMGVDVDLIKKYINSVDLSSRRIVVPEIIEDKVVTLNYLNQICHKDFLGAKISDNLSVMKSLNMMMKNVISSIRFSHPKTSCAYDSDCHSWFYNENIALLRLSNTYRCLIDSKEKFQYCGLRGLRGQSCTIYNSKGVRISSGSFEFSCDKGLKCIKVKEEGWFQGGELYQYAKGECLP
jgi:hypothetical protein